MASMRRNVSGYKNGHIARAERAIAKAKTEYETARKAKDELAASQAAEKAWLAVSEATNAFLWLKGVPERKIPEGHRSAFFLLRKYGNTDMLRTFSLVRSVLHGDVFYRGQVEWGLTSEVIAEAEGFVDRVRSLSEKR